MRKFKRICAIVLAVCMMMTIVPFSVISAESVAGECPANGGNHNWQGDVFGFLTCYNCNQAFEFCGNEKISETFSSGFGDWDVIDGTGDGYGWSINNGKAYAPGESNNDWLISPAVTLENELAFLSFVRNSSSGVLDIYIYEGDEYTSTTDFVGINYDSDSTSPVIELTDYVGKTVRIGFKYTGNGNTMSFVNINVSDGYLNHDFTDSCACNRCGARNEDDHNVIFHEGFDGKSVIPDWYTIDSDGDGRGWFCQSGDIRAAGSSGFSSESYDNNIGVLTPDNWLVSSQIELTGSNNRLSYYIGAQDPNYIYEHYAVYVYTGAIEQPDADDAGWVMLRDETITWSNRILKNIILDLSAFDGQTVRVAFRHYNCADAFRIVVDEVSVFNDTSSLHNYEFAETTTATCKTPGYTRYACTVCGDYYDTDIDTTSSHDFEYTTDLAATCADPAMKVYTCSICGLASYEPFGSALGHKYEYMGEVPPTCTEKGYDVFTCSVCDYSFNEIASDATGHDYQMTETQPTCQETGYYVYTCSSCDDTYREPFGEIVGHDFEGRCACSYCGLLNPNINIYSFYESFDSSPENWYSIDADGDEFNWSFDSSGFAYSMSIYFYSGFYPVPLNPDNWLISPQIEIEDGDSLSFRVSGYNLGAYRENYAVYIYTGEEETPDQNDPAWVLLNEETISWPGELEYRTRAYDLSEYAGETVRIAFRHFDCTDQYALILDDVAISNSSVTENLTHNYEEEVVPETCTTDGYSVFVCADCNTGYTVPGEPALGHTYNGYCSCLTCGEPNPETENVNHEYDSVTTAPTCTNDGYVTYTCSLCEDSYTEEGEPATGHDYEGKCVCSICGSLNTLISSSSEGFEGLSGNTPDGWYVIDANNDGHNWKFGVNGESDRRSARTGTGFAYSESYVNSTAVTPDNWLVSPQITVADGDMLSYWVSGYSDGYYYEKYSVYIYTGDAEIPDQNDPAWVELDTETISWPNIDFRNRTSDLSDYVGETVRIAFRHYDCRDEYNLILDDVSIMNLSADVEHDYELASTTATCTEAGTATYTCVGCGHTYTEETEALGHDLIYDFEDADEHYYYCQRANCDVDGYEAHTFTDGVCTGCEYDINRYGDVNNDGDIDDLDDMILTRHLAGWEVEINLITADVNGDGDVDDLDNMILTRYLAGWEVESKIVDIE